MMIDLCIDYSTYSRILRFKHGDSIVTARYYDHNDIDDIVTITEGLLIDLLKLRDSDDKQETSRRNAPIPGYNKSYRSNTRTPK